MSHKNKKFRHSTNTLHKSSTKHLTLRHFQNNYTFQNLDILQSAQKSQSQFSKPHISHYQWRNTSKNVICTFSSITSLNFLSKSLFCVSSFIFWYSLTHFQFSLLKLYSKCTLGLPGLSIITKYKLYLLISLECYRKHFHISIISRFSCLPWRIGRAHISYPNKAGEEAVSDALQPASASLRTRIRCLWSVSPQPLKLITVVINTELPTVFHLSIVSLEEPSILSHVTAMSELHQCCRSCSFLSEIRLHLQITVVCSMKLLIWNCRFRRLWNTEQGLVKILAGS